MIRFVNAAALVLGVLGLCSIAPGWAAAQEAGLEERIEELEQGRVILESRIQQLEARIRTLFGDEAVEPVRNIPLGESPKRGDPGGRATLIVFADYQSTYSSRAEYALGRLLETYPNGLRIVHKHYPLRTLHPHAHDAALAAIAAHRQGRFWQMHEQLVRNSLALNPALFGVLAGEIGLDLLQFDRDRTSLWALEQLDADEKAAVAAGVDGVPALFLNGRRLSTWRYDSVKAEIAQILSPDSRR